MRIVADENIPFVKDAFADFGAVETVTGRGISPQPLQDASILLVRSVTKVDSELLAESVVKFVGTATIGTDHIDTAWLQKSAIGFAYAPGSNANSVAEYVITAMVHLAQAQKKRLADLTLGIIGVGNIGSQVLRMAQALGIRCLLNDPPKKKQTGSSVYIPLEQLLAEADVVTMHVPLIRQGENATFHLANQEFFAAMKAGAIFINTSRGGVVNEQHLVRNRPRLGGVVLDVWENEPEISTDTLAIADIATPHIAGYSYDGKVRGTGMLLDAASAFFFKSKSWNVQAVLAGEPVTVLELTGASNVVHTAVTSVCPLLRDNEAMRGLLRLTPAERGKAFDALRKNYPKRLEFSHFQVNCADPQNRRLLEGLGFGLVGRELSLDS
jgi:erythronate-4-phosphate dehydrogenase